MRRNKGVLTVEDTEVSARLGVFQPQPTEAAIDGLDSPRHGERKSDLGAHKIILPTEPTTDNRTGFVNGGDLRRFVHFPLVRAIEFLSANTTLSPPDSPKEDFGTAAISIVKCALELPQWVNRDSE
jgi:hypothetical protein